MLILHMLIQRLAVRRRLEVLAADLADDGLGCFVLQYEPRGSVSERIYRESVRALARIVGQRSNDIDTPSIDRRDNTKGNFYASDQVTTENLFWEMVKKLCAEWRERERPKRSSRGRLSPRCVSFKESEDLRS